VDINTNYKIFLESYKSKNLRYISTGWARIYPDSNTYETPANILKETRENEAQICFYFGDQLDEILLLKCKCVDYKQSTCYRFNFEKIKKLDDVDNSKGTSIGFSDYYIKSFKFYEPYNPIYSVEQGEEKYQLIKENYLSNGLLIEFKNGKFMSLYGTEGDDQHEPTIYFNFLESDEIEIYKIDNMMNWKLEHEI
jgi:hypothetical protein